ncbi:MAG: lipopolysaccharide biosynthesis protein [Myxococcales bacterium]|nr:lipopolysaccharide biosynthesis protein [Myxococcales bacterium]
MADDQATDARDPEPATATGASPAPGAGGDEARKAGRGGAFVLAAKVFFQLVGFAQQALLPKAIGLAGYGGFSRVFAPVSVVSNVIVFGFTQGVSRAVAGAGDKDREAFRAAYRVNLALGFAIALAFLALSPALAWFQHAPHITRSLMVMSGLLLAYSAYAPLIGYLNGKGQFGRQASLDMIAATLRTSGLVGLGYLFRKQWDDGVLGSAVGAVLAAGLILLLALSMTGTGAKPSAADADDPRIPRALPYFIGLAPVMLAQLFTSGLMQADITVLGHFLSAAAPADDAAPQKLADEWVGVYRACQLFAFLPYQLLFSVTQVLFPMLAKASKEGDQAAVSRLVARGSRLGVLVTGLFASVVVSLPASLLGFVYGPDVSARGAATLRVLGLGQASFAIFGLATTVLVSLGRERRAMRLTALALGANLLFGWGLVGRASFGGPQLVAAATATTLSIVAALIYATHTVRREAGAFVPAGTAARVGGLLVALAAAGQLVPRLSKPVTVLACVGVVVTYLLVLVVSGELGPDDLAVVKGVVARRRK